MKWKLHWQDCYRNGMTLCGCGGMCAVLATPGTIILLSQGIFDIVMLWLIIASMIYVGWILIKYAEYKRLYIEWVELLERMNQQMPPNDKD